MCSHRCGSRIQIIVGTAIVVQSWCLCFPVAVPVINSMDVRSPQPGTSIVVEPRLLLCERLVKALQRLAKGAHHFHSIHHRHRPPWTPRRKCGVVSVAPAGGGGATINNEQICFVFVAFQGPRFRIRYYLLRFGYLEQICLVFASIPGPAP